MFLLFLAAQLTCACENRLLSVALRVIVSRRRSLFVSVYYTGWPKKLAHFVRRITSSNVD